MPQCTLGIFSFRKKEPKIVRALLERPSVSRIVFPATLPTHPGGDLRLESAEQFDMSMVPKEFYAAQSVVNIPLYSDNGIEFHATIYLIETVVPNAINLMFTTEHLQRGIVTLASLKSLLAESISVFDADFASVYDDESSHWPGGTKYFMDSNYRSWPLAIDWITYFGPQMIQLLGRERFASLHTYAEMYDLHGGIMVILQDEPFREDDVSYRDRQAQAEAELRLSELGTEKNVS